MYWSDLKRQQPSGFVPLIDLRKLMPEDMKVDLGGGREGRRPVSYPPNTMKSKQEPVEKTKKIDQITTGTVTARKKSLPSRFSGSIISETGSSVMQYLVMDVLLPAAKNTISDVVSQGIERLLFGDARPRSSGSGRPGGYVNYSRPNGASPTRQMSQRARATHEFDDIILETRVEAEEVLDRLKDLIDQYDSASVNDLYDLIGITSTFSDDQWGWYDLRGAGVRHIRSGYLLSLPRPQPLS